MSKGHYLGFSMSRYEYLGSIKGLSEPRPLLDFSDVSVDVLSLLLNEVQTCSSPKKLEILDGVEYKPP